jgi:hypothetical protein
MSTLAISQPHAFAVQSANRGESSTAKALEKNFNLAKAHMTAAHVLKLSAIEMLTEVFATCREVAWDGYNALPLSHASFTNATKFLEILPSWAPVPEIAPEPDGEIALEWRRGASVFSVSFGTDGTLNYAGLLGYKKQIHGTEPFDDSIPQVILESIRRLN